MSKTKQLTPEWEIKDRRYYLLQNAEPLTYTLGSRNSRRHSLLWFDPIKNEQRELRYATNMNSPFVDEQKGEAILGHIIFEDGVLAVPKENKIYKSYFHYTILEKDRYTKSGKLKR